MHLIFDASVSTLDYDCRTDQPLRDLKREAMARFNLDTTEADRYLIACDGARLEETKTLAELGLPETSVIILWRLGGSARTSPLNAHREDSSMYARY